MVDLCATTYFLISVIIVTGGNGDGSTFLTSVEVLSPSGVLLPCSSVPPLPAPRIGYTLDGAVACGGWSGSPSGPITNCISLTASSWTISHQLQEARMDHVSWSSPAGILLMGGSGNTPLNTTELLTNTSSMSFDLDYNK